MRAKILVYVLPALILATIHLAEAQQAGKLPRIGYVAQRNAPTAANPDLAADAFQQGLRDLGYLDGKNIRIEYRYAEGSDERIRALVAELVQLKVDVLVTVPLPAIHAAKQATKTIPIVMVTTRDPVATRLIDSLARPGGNLTGVTRLTRELSGKRLELLKEVAPNVSRVGVLGDVDSTNFKDYEPAARALGIRLQSIDVQNDTPDFETAFQNAVKQRVNALVTISGAFTLSYRQTDRRHCD